MVVTLPAPTASHVVDRRRFAFEQCGNVRDGHDLVRGGIASWSGSAYFLRSLSLSNVRWHGRETELCILYTDAPAAFLQYKKNSKNYYVALASAGALSTKPDSWQQPNFPILIGLAKTSFRADCPLGWPGTRFEQTVFKTP